MYKHTYKCICIRTYAQTYAHAHPHKEHTQRDLTRTEWGTALSALPWQWAGLAVGRCGYMWAVILHSVFHLTFREKVPCFSLPPILVTISPRTWKNIKKYKEGDYEDCSSTDLSLHNPTWLSCLQEEVHGWDVDLLYVAAVPKSGGL